MLNEMLMDKHDMRLDLYLGNIERFTGSFPTHDEVEAAMHAFCPLDPITEDILAKKSVSSLSVLTKILYIPYYPDLLGLLAAPTFLAKCLMDIEEYLRSYKVILLYPFMIVLEMTAT